LGQALVLMAIAFLGAIVVGLTGFGSALITIPLATYVVPLPFALALYALVDLSSAAAVGFENPKNAVREEWKRLVPMILVGTVIGVTLLVNLPRRAALLLLGVFVVSYAVYALFSRPGHRIVSASWGWLAGLGGGITSTVFGAGGPPYVIYLSHRGLSKEAFRATLGLTTLTSISLRVVAFVITGLLLDWHVWLTALLAVPAALAGVHVARKIYFAVSREVLMRAVAVVLLVSGTSLVIRAF
jgi:uncharacterized membrane protein YfcA